MNRRHMIGFGAAALGLAASGRRAHAASNTAAPGPGGTRRIGPFSVSSLGLGVQNITRTYQGTTPNRAEMVGLIRAAYDRGVTFFDTAEAYGSFECERILGEATEPFREQIILCTKFGWNIDPETGQMLGGMNSRPAHVRRAVEGSLRRLRTDRIDLAYQHRVDPAVPIEDVAEVIRGLMQEGKVRAWGLSEMGPQTMRRAHLALPLAAVQCEYSLLSRGAEDWIIPSCEELGIAFVPFQPLGAGFLTGSFGPRHQFGDQDGRRAAPRFAPENLPYNYRLVELTKHWARQKRATPAQVSLAWLLAQKSWIIPIPGTTQLKHMTENFDSKSIKFSDAELAQLSASAASIQVRGARQPASILSLSYVESPPLR